MRVEIPRPLRRLQAALDAPLYLVGGAVRNALLGLPPGDLDAAGPLPPEAAASRCALAGLAAAPVDRALGTLLIRVPAPYTSQTCNQCGHIAKGNRESQAVFRCENCAHTDNADHNAALNIRDKGLQHLTQGTDWA